MARIHKPRRCQRTMSCRTRISCQLGRACEPRIESVDMRYAVQPKKGRKVDSLQAVGQPNSTCETVEMWWREVEKEPYITVQLCKAISKRKHYLHIEVENIMEIGENIAVSKRKSRNGIHIHRALNYGNRICVFRIRYLWTSSCQVMSEAGMVKYLNRNLFRFMVEQDKLTITKIIFSR